MDWRAARLRCARRVVKKAGWKRVVHADECDEWDNCPVCKDVDFADCPCPGPTQDDVYEYREDEDGTMWARPLKKRKTL